ncbi:hypothetical protein RND71_003785 [Anisodus tanguticus]|uniref:Yippee domain-containing protein n=1 Tax=Anisodus tanguticus TaxID=243964 RepID=A0AAE1SV81_9SOLA|nr:hypothetical protein RND71_003785 [Anisodus tanguticus]
MQIVGGKKGNTAPANPKFNSRWVSIWINCCKDYYFSLFPTVALGIILISVEQMGRLFVITLEGGSYKCKHCQTHLALADHIISKSFHCSHGKAYLFDNVVNVTVGEKEERMMMTGMHTVVDIFCVGCGSIVGWKYEAAHDKTQKYKEGKFILERFKVAGPDGSLYTVSYDSQLGSDADE